MRQAHHPELYETKNFSSLVELCPLGRSVTEPKNLVTSRPVTLEGAKHPIEPTALDPIGRLTTPSRMTPLSSIVFRLSSFALVRLIRQAHHNSQDETIHAKRFAHSRASQRISSSPSTCRPRITNLPLHITESIALEFAE